MFENLYALFDDARYERRGTYDFLLVPQIPIAQFNAVWPLDDGAAPELEGAVGEIEASGLRCSVQLRRDRTPRCLEEAKRLGLTTEYEMPAMVVRAGALATSSVSGLEISRVAGDDERAQAAATAAAGFGAPLEIFEPIYRRDVLAVEGLRCYLGRVDGAIVSTSVGYTVGDCVGVFNVATPPEHRGHGYGGALSAAAARDGLDDGAELAWLQSSAMGFSVYKRLGFETVATDVMLMR